MPIQTRQSCTFCGKCFTHLQKHLSQSTCGKVRGYHDNSSSQQGVIGEEEEEGVDTRIDDGEDDAHQVPVTVTLPTRPAAGRDTTHPRNTTDNSRRGKRRRVATRSKSSTTLSRTPMTPGEPQVQDDVSALQENEIFMEDCWDDIFNNAVEDSGREEEPREEEQDQEGEGNNTAPVVQAPPGGNPRVVPFNTEGNNIVLSKWERSMAALHQLCDKAGAPRYLGDSIMAWLKTQMNNGFDPRNPAIKKREALMYHLHAATGAVPPEAVPLTLECGKHVVVYRFPLKEMLQQHLLGRAFCKEENLQLDRSRHLWWQGPPTKAGDLHSGKWYENTLHQYEAMGERARYMIHPLLFYIDKTGTDMKQTQALEPLMATSTLLTQKAREDTSNWFPIGLMPNISLPSSAHQRIASNRKASRSTTVRDYHRCLSILLEPLKTLQKDHPVLHFRRGDEVATFHILCPTAGFCGDNLAADTLCGRVHDYGPTSPRLSRRCLTPSRLADAIHHECHPIQPEIVTKLSMGALGCTYGFQALDDGGTRGEGFPDNLLRIPTIPPSANLDVWIKHMDGLPRDADRAIHKRCRQRREAICDVVLHKVLGSHSFHSAFEGMDFGSNRYGIFKGTLSDIMHTVEEGLIPRVLSVVLGEMSDQNLGRLDSFVEGQFHHKGVNRSSEKQEFPRVNFTRGYSSLTLLSAEERVGQLFTLSLVLQTKKGRDILVHRFDPSFDMLNSSSSTDHQSENPPPQPARANEEATQDTTQPTEEEIKQFIDRIGLGYLLDDIHPQLPQFHADLLMEVLRSTIRKTWVREVQNITFPPSRWDYQSTNDIEDSPPLPCPPRNSSRGGSGVFHVQAERRHCSLRLTMDQTVYLLETILTFHAFLKYGHESVREQGRNDSTGPLQQPYNEALQMLRTVLTLGVDRGEGTQGWRLQKFVELGHFWEDVVAYGWPQGYSTSTGERGLKSWAKVPARTSQKRSDTIFSGQVCERIHEASILQQVLPHEHTGADHGDIVPSSTIKQGTSLYWTSEGIVLKGPTSRTKPSTIVFPEQVHNWFLERYGGRHDAHGIPLFMEIYVAEKTIIRGHPNYRQSGPWYDFVLLSYAIEGYEEEQHMPARCFVFFQDPLENNTRCVLVQECKYQSDVQSNSMSQICSHWTLDSRTCVEGQEAILVAYPTETISQRIHAISEEYDPNPLLRTGGSSFDFIWVHSRKETWPGSFLQSPRFLPRD